MNKSIISKIPTYLAIYIACWVLSYVIVNNDFNTSLMLEYFKLAWSFNGLERPTYTQIISLIIFFPTIGLIYFMLRKKGNGKK